MQTSYTIRQRKDSNKYQAIIRQKEGSSWHQVESKTFDKKNQATQWAIKTSSEWQQKIENDYEKMTLGRLKEIYLDDLRDRVRPHTYRTSVSLLRYTPLDDKIITTIKPIEYKNFIKNSKPGTIYKMKTFYNYIIRELKIKIDNPFLYYPRKKAKEKRNIEEKEFKEIIKNISNDDLKLICKIAYYAGLRISEILGLTTSDIQNSSIKVTKQYDTRNKKFTLPKSKNGIRTVPIPNHLNKDLMSFMENKNVLSIDRRLFNSSLSFYRRNLNKASKCTNNSNVTFHHFRHSYITRLVQNGLDLKTTAYLAGDDLNTIVKTYIHYTKDTYKIAEDFIQKNM